MENLSKRRKVDGENRLFRNSWTHEYFYFLPPRTDARPVCLLCHETVAVIKVANVKRHFETKQKDYGHIMQSKTLSHFSH